VPVELTLDVIRGDEELSITVSPRAEVLLFAEEGDIRKQSA